MISIFRLCSSQFLANSGRGAAIFGGRWNRVGTEVIYAAESPSLAALEILVHFSSLPGNFALTQILIPEDVSMLTWDLASLPDGWDSEVPSALTQDLGEKWVQSAEHAVLRIPSSIVPTDFNYVINPAHPLFPRIEFGAPKPFRFDPRLK